MNDDIQSVIRARDHLAKMYREECAYAQYLHKAILTHCDGGKVEPRLEGGTNFLAEKLNARLPATDKEIVDHFFEAIDKFDVVQTGQSDE